VALVVLLSQTEFARVRRFIKHSCHRPTINARKIKLTTTVRFSDELQTHSRSGLLWTTFKRLPPLCGDQALVSTHSFGGRGKMITILLIGLILLALAVWLILKVRPTGTILILALALSLVICAVYSYWIITGMAQGSDSAWGPALAICGSSIILPLILIGTVFTNRLISGKRN
jgi:hypothetical protein